MNRRHRDIPRQWLIVDDRLGPEPLRRVARLPRGSGVLLLGHELDGPDRQRLARRLRTAARSRGFVLLEERSGTATRVHDAKEIRYARLTGARLLLLSPLYPTRSHPDWRPLPRMRAAALARLAGRPLIALGGMNARKFRAVAPLGFDGWAGIDAFRT